MRNCAAGIARWLLVPVVAIVLMSLCPTRATAQTYLVTSTADDGSSGTLRWAINQANAAGSGTQTIDFSLAPNSTITLTSALPILDHPSGTITIDGSGASGLSISGNSTNRVFFVAEGNVSIANVALVQGGAHGGNGGTGWGGGGGGLGAGGALFVNAGANVTIQNVTLDHNTAVGGTGGAGGISGAYGGGGGGGFGGNGGNAQYSGAGGGGFAGNGGNSVYGAGGGGGVSGNGGNGDEGGGGGGGTTVGGNASSNGGTGNGGATGGTQGTNTNSSGVNAGAGGNGQAGSSGGGGGGGGEGGNANASPPRNAGSPGNGGSGGNGGTGGGGGGGAETGGSSNPRFTATGGNGGNGGTYGGGGGAGEGTSGSYSGHGGTGGDFGGGGGAGTGSWGPHSGAGNGGFGGGGGGAGGGNSGTGGFGGGNGGDALQQGDGGSGYGGAVFVRQGGTLTVIGTDATAQNSVTAGTGNSDGQAAGSNLYLMTGVNATFNGSDNTTFAGSISGAGGVDVNTTGTVTFSGSNNYSGGTTVDAGTLIVNGTTTGTMTVNSGGTLMGGGTVGDTTVYSGGTIYPGTVGAPLTISGAYTQQPNSTYSVEVNPTGSDKLIVTGAANINGGKVNVVLDPGTYTTGTRYTILTSVDGVSGHYDSLIAPTTSTGQYFTLDYEPFEIDLILNADPGTHFALLAETFNQFNVATAIDNTSVGATGDYATVIGQLSSLSNSQLPGALNQLVGDIYSSISTIELQNTTTWLQLVSNRLASQLSPESSDVSTPVSVAEDKIDGDVQLVSYQQPDGQTVVAPRFVFRKTKLPRWTGWTQGYGQGASVAGNGNAGGLGYGLGGTLFGLDRWLSGNTLVGMMGGYAGSSVGDRLVGSNAHINAYQVGLYGTHRRGRFYLSNIDALSFDSEAVSRPINFGTIARTATGSSTGTQFAHYSETGLTLGRGLTRFQPFSGIQYIYLSQRGYNETGAGSVNLAIGNQNISSVRGSVGCRVYQEYAWKKVSLIPVAQARYQREWADGSQLITSSFSGAPTASFVTAGNTLGRNFGLFGLGSNAILGPRTSLYSGYDLQIASGYAAHMGSASFQYRW